MTDDVTAIETVDEDGRFVQTFEEMNGITYVWPDRATYELFGNPETKKWKNWPGPLVRQ